VRCIGIITTVKRRQEFRIRLQRRARRRVEKLLEGAEDERQRQLVGVHFAVSLSQFSVDTDTCSKMSDNVAYLANQARFYIGWIRRGAAAPVFSQAPVLPPMQVITLQRVLIRWEGFGNGDLELTVDTFQELAASSPKKFSARNVPVANAFHERWRFVTPSPGDLSVHTLDIGLWWVAPILSIPNYCRLLQSKSNNVMFHASEGSKMCYRNEFCVQGRRSWGGWSWPGSEYVLTP